MTGANVIRKPISGTAAGVPFVALPPAEGTETAPLVFTWHLGAPPRSERAMAAAMPLRGLAAWRVYLGLPMLGSRLPDGGLDEFLRLFRADMVLNVFEPVILAAAGEFPAALAELRERLSVDVGPLGLIGGSMGAWVTQTVLSEINVPVSAVALVSPAIRLASVVERYERASGRAYSWSERSRAIAHRLDFVARADELAAKDAATLLVIGAGDDEQGFHAPARELHEALAQRSTAPTALVEIPEMAHALADGPGLEPAPQNAQAAHVDAAVVQWFRQHLTGRMP